MQLLQSNAAGVPDWVPESCCVPSTVPALKVCPARLYLVFLFRVGRIMISCSSLYSASRV